MSLNERNPFYANPKSTNTFTTNESTQHQKDGLICPNCKRHLSIPGLWRVCTELCDSKQTGWNDADTSTFQKFTNTVTLLLSPVAGTA